MGNKRDWLGALALTASGAVCADQALTMEALDKRLASLEESSASSAASAVSDRISLNGFITYMGDIIAGPFTVIEGVTGVGICHRTRASRALILVNGLGAHGIGGGVCRPGTHHGSIG